MLLFISFHWLVPVGLFLVFVSLATVLAGMHSVNAHLWSRVDSVKRLSRKKAKTEKQFSSNKKIYEDQENQIVKKITLKAEDLAKADYKKLEAEHDKIEDELSETATATAYFIEQVETKIEKGKKHLQNIYNGRSAKGLNGNLSKITAILALLLLPLSFTGCDQTVRPTHNKCLILDMSGSMVHQYKAAELTKGILGHDFETGDLYEDGISVVITTIGDNSNARKVTFSLPPTKGYWSVDEGQRKKEMEAFYTDVLTAISRILASEDKRPMSYINRSTAHVANHFDEQGGDLFIMSDMSQENVFSVSFPKMFNKYGFNFLDHYDTMAASLTKDAPYELNNINVHIVHTPAPEMDEYFRLCSKFWSRFLQEKGAKSVEFTASINSSY